MSDRLNRIYRRVSRSARLSWARVRWPITGQMFRESLGELLGERRRILLVHGSLSHCGWMVGGEAMVVGALREWCGTLCVPRHAYCYPEREGEAGPIYDPFESPSQVGQLTNYFRKLEGVVESLHPSHAVAAIGPDAEALCRDHDRALTPCGDRTPYARLLELDASVLMLGATLGSYTLFHTAEHHAGCWYLYGSRPVRLRVRDDRGLVREIWSKRQNMKVERRFAEARLDLEGAGLLVSRRLGRGEVLFISSAAAAHRFVVGRLGEDPWWLVGSGSRPNPELVERGDGSWIKPLECGVGHLEWAKEGT